MLLTNAATTNPRRRSGAKTAKSESSDKRNAVVDAIKSAWGENSADMRLPNIMAESAQYAPRSLWTRSRNTNARPTIRTPLGANIPGKTGIKHGPSGTH